MITLIRKILTPFQKTITLFRKTITLFRKILTLFRKILTLFRHAFIVHTVHNIRRVYLIRRLDGVRQPRQTTQEAAGAARRPPTRRRLRLADQLREELDRVRDVVLRRRRPTARGRHHRLVEHRGRPAALVLHRGAVARPRLRQRGDPVALAPRVVLRCGGGGGGDGHEARLRALRERRQQVGDRLQAVVRAVVVRR